MVAGGAADRLGLGDGEGAAGEGDGEGEGESSATEGDGEGDSAAGWVGEGFGSSPPHAARRSSSAKKSLLVANRLDHTYRPRPPSGLEAADHGHEDPDGEGNCHRGELESVLNRHTSLMAHGLH